MHLCEVFEYLDSKLIDKSNQYCLEDKKEKWYKKMMVNLLELMTAGVKLN